MRDLDRFSKRTPVRRSEQISDAGMHVSWLGTFCRLFVVLLFIGAFSWGAWKISQPANIWTSNSEIQKAEKDLREIHREGEKARKELESPREVSVESLVYRALNDGYELTEEERLFVQSNWKKFVQNAQIHDDENLLFRLKMRHAEDGSIEDFPPEEWATKDAELKKAAKENSQEEQLRQVMMDEVQEVVRKNGKVEEARLKSEDQKKKAASERRSNREIVRNVVEEAKENIYSGKPIDETDSEEVRPLEEGKTAEEAKPSEEGKDAEEVKPSDEEKADEEEKPSDEEKVSDSKENSQNE